ncbi:Alpha/Beta hydrolase protein [Lipomyces oligophaga]|uniref:Alpha/Beta hydrolase protein n=1 Tax=Lipomyces oligophaga TaxID=45792 RepID=UPI0034CFBEF5
MVKGLSIVTVATGLAAICSSVAAAVSAGSAHRPVVMWHGLGDDYKSDGMERVAAVIKEKYPDIFIHSIYLDEDPEKDSKATLVGNLNEELELVYEQLNGIPELQDGFDALGFSQGGLFFRGYIERYSSPKVYNLVTFGSPQNGVADFPPCSDFFCRRRNAVIKTQAYTAYAQNELTVAQYYRDPKRYEQYLEMSGFLADINNERPDKNETYACQIADLEKLVLYMFTEDTTVNPKESAWFADEDFETGDIIPLQERDLYKQDWIGLKSLAERGALEMLTLEGRHMNITNETVEFVARHYLGAPSTLAVPVSSLSSAVETFSADKQAALTRLRLQGLQGIISGFSLL